jgi:ubiquinone/menaquinone biosynthesis C-methylase UbiE
VNPGLSITDWDHRFRIQSQWSAEIRKICYQKYPLPPFSKVLEVGCGTGAVLSDIPNIPGGLTTGIDLDFSSLRFFREINSEISLIGGDGYHLPLAPGVFDQCFCHYLLLWLKDPITAILEIKRVLTKGGIFFIFSEPDYGGRIDFPLELGVLKEMQIESLLGQGADPYMGRKILGLLRNAGFKSVHTGTISWSSSETNTSEEFESEWQIITHDNVEKIPKEQFAKIKSLDTQAHATNTRVQYIPIFYGWGEA